MTIKTGSICKHPARKSAIYLIIVEDGGYFMVRVKKQVGYPISASGRYLISKTSGSDLTEVAFHEPYANYTREDCLRSKHRVGSGRSVGHPAVKTRGQLTDAQFNEFLQLSTDLSPENLCCDGELSLSQTRVRYNQLKADWARLENRCGLSVSEDFIWDTYIESRKGVLNG